VVIGLLLKQCRVSVVARALVCCMSIPHWIAEYAVHVNTVGFSEYLVPHEVA